MPDQTEPIDSEPDVVIPWWLSSLLIAHLRENRSPLAGYLTVSDELVERLIQGRKISQEARARARR